MKVVLFLLALVMSVSANAQGANSVEQFRLLMQERLQETKAPFEAQRQVLRDGFIGKVEEIRQHYQEKGDLERALQARDEIKKVRETGEVGTDEFPELQAFREIYEKKSSEISGKEKEEVVALRRGFVRGIEMKRSDLTREGKIEEALEFSKMLEEEKKEIEHLESGGARTIELDSLQIVGGEEANGILEKLNPRDSLLNKAKVAASSFHPNRKEPDAVQRRSRPKELEDMEDRDVWCVDGSSGKGPTGWIEFTWEEPILAKSILLVNRPTVGNADLWELGEVSVNGKLLTKFTDFKRAHVALIELKEAFVFKQLKIECKEGTWSPGLYSVEVYP